jgi:hypothetical protein
LYAKLLGFGAVYGFGFTLIKSLFPTPVILLFAGGDSSEGDLTTLASVYMLSGLLAGIIGGPLLGAFLLRRRGSLARARVTQIPGSGTDLGKSLALSLGFAIFIGFISTLLTMGAYGFGLLPPGGVLDPLTLIRSSNFSPGTPLLVAWTFARDLLPAMLAGLFLSPIGGGFLYRVYAAGRPADTTPNRARVIEDEF